MQSDEIVMYVVMGITALLILIILFYLIRGIIRWVFNIEPKPIQTQTIREKLSGKYFRIREDSDGVWRTSNHNLSLSGDSPDSVIQKIKDYFKVK